MLTQLATPYADTRADQLSWTLTELADAAADEPRALGRLTLPGASGELDLRLLGSSHAVTLRLSSAQLTETVACPRFGGDAEPLPTRRELTLPGLSYRFRSAAVIHSPARLGALAGWLRCTFGNRPDACVGVFPGSPDALTVVQGHVGRERASWQSWHLYPNTGEVVRTSTTTTQRPTRRTR